MAKLQSLTKVVWSVKQTRKFDPCVKKKSKRPKTIWKRLYGCHMATRTRTKTKKLRYFELHLQFNSRTCQRFISGKLFLCCVSVCCSNLQSSQKITIFVGIKNHETLIVQPSCWFQYVLLRPLLEQNLH